MHAALKEHQDLVKILVNFVEGNVDGSTLDQSLQDPSMQKLLGIFEDPRSPARTNHFNRLFKQDRVTVGGLLNSQGIIQEYLVKAGAPFTPSSKYEDQFDIFLDCTPSYVDPPLQFLEELAKDQPTKKLLKQRIKEAFPYEAKPPKWIQAPAWPIFNGTPMLFINEVEVDNRIISHDSGKIYIFYCLIQKQFELITQFY